VRRRRRQGWLERVDCDLFDRVSASRTPALDRVLPRLSRAANHSMLWIAAAGGLVLTDRTSGRRAAVRGLGSIAVTSAVVNLGVKRIARRPRPSLRRVPAIRRLPVQPLTTSFPSGHAASAAAFTVGVGVERPRAAVALAPAAAAVAYSRVYVGVHYPADVLVGAAIGSGVALLSRLQWPARPRAARTTPPAEDARRLDPNPDGSGLVMVVNRDAGPPLVPDPLDDLRSMLPRATVVEAGGDDDLPAVLDDAAGRARVLGVSGGDGTATAAAERAVARDLPLLLVPTGTLNHLARDLRLESAGSALAAVRQGEAVGIDVASLDGRPFLNTAGFGNYAAMLDTRKALENRVGRWPAHVMAVAQALFRARPLDVVVNGEPHRIWMAVVGNCRHEPPGFAPSWRPSLDDGRLDVRLLLGEAPLARLRLILSLLAGRLTQSISYRRFEATEVSVSTGRSRLRLVRDGETFDGRGDFTISKLPRRLVVYRPHRVG
jgi:diacylglycerol kinase family enzyme/membrane-associated phospholipid phosphatase